MKSASVWKILPKISAFSRATADMKGVIKGLFVKHFKRASSAQINISPSILDEISFCLEDNAKNLNLFLGYSMHERVNG